MSALIKLKVSFKHRPSVVAALKQAGFVGIQESDDGIVMHDYELQRGLTEERISAEVIVPHRANQLLSDIGFRRVGSELAMVISDTDQPLFVYRMDAKNWDDAVGSFSQMYASHYIQSQNDGSYQTNVEKVGDEIHITMDRWV